MKIYFSGSIRGGRKYAKIYAKTIKFLEKFGEVLTKHVGDPQLTHFGEGDHVKEIYERDIRLLRSAGILIADVTQPSLGVGYEIAAAEGMKKKIICLCRESRIKRLSAMIDGNRKLRIICYKNQKDLENKLDNVLSKDIQNRKKL